MKSLQVELFLCCSCVSVLQRRWSKLRGPLWDRTFEDHTGGRVLGTGKLREPVRSKWAIHEHMANLLYVFFHSNFRLLCCWASCLSFSKFSPEVDHVFFLIHKFCLFCALCIFCLLRFQLWFPLRPLGWASRGLELGLPWYALILVASCCFA